MSLSYMRKHAYKVLRRCHCLDLIIHYFSLFFHVFIFYCFVLVRVLYVLTMYLIYFEKMKDNKNKKNKTCQFLHAMFPFINMREQIQLHLFSKSYPSTSSLKLSNFNRRVMSYILSDNRANDILNKAIVICKIYMM